MEETPPAVKAYDLYTQFIKLDTLLGSTPVSKHHTLDWESISDLHANTSGTDGDREERQADANLLADTLSKHVKRPDSIPGAYMHAYRAALAGRQYVNSYVTSPQFLDGPMCTCSEALDALSVVDLFAGTSLRTRLRCCL